MSTHFRNMMPVPIDEFLSRENVGCDIYIRLSTEKFVTLAKKGQKVDRDRMEKYKSKAVNYLYIRRQDYVHHVEDTVTIASIEVPKEEVNLEAAEHILHRKARPFFHSMEEYGFNSNVFEQAQRVCEAAITVSNSKAKIWQLLESLSKSDNHFLNHSIGVSVVAPMIGMALGWQSRTVVEKLSLGGLLHDIGKRSLPEELIFRPIDNMTHDERVIYESHPENGAQILGNFKFVPNDIIAIVMQHHERADGFGFPKKLRDIKIHPLARVVGLANEFVEHALKSPINSKPKDPLEVVIQFSKRDNMTFNKEVLKALYDVCQGKDFEMAS